MIIFVHIPKTGGQTFEDYLGRIFGSENILLDYGNKLFLASERGKHSLPLAPGLKAKAKSIIRQSRLGQRALRQYRNLAPKPQTLNNIPANIECIQGHFSADKYADQYPKAKYITWIREPAQRLMSHWLYWKRIMIEFPNSVPSWFSQKMSFKDFALSREMQNYQSKYLGSKELKSFDFVGITEQYDQSIRLFNQCFGIDQQIKPENRNRNPERPREGYEIEEELKRQIAEFHQKDYELYFQAQGLFQERMTEIQTEGKPPII